MSVCRQRKTFLQEPKIRTIRRSTATPHERESSLQSAGGLVPGLTFVCRVQGTQLNSKLLSKSRHFSGQVSPVPLLFPSLLPPSHQQDHANTPTRDLPPAEFNYSMLCLLVTGGGRARVLRTASQRCLSSRLSNPAALGSSFSPPTTPSHHALLLSSPFSSSSGGQRPPRKFFDAKAKSFGSKPKLGDWKCPDCMVNNFASRNECFKCKARKPLDAQQQEPGVVGQQPPSTVDGVLSSHASVPHAPSVPSSGPPRRVQGVYPADWHCLSCRHLNFARRVECKQCKAPRNDAPPVGESGGA